MRGGRFKACRIERKVKEEVEEKSRRRGHIRTNRGTGLNQK
jgi:hypothetical protein